MSTPSILPSSDAVCLITTDVSNFYNFFEITFDVSNINNLNVNNVYYGFSQNNNVFENINFSNSEVMTGNSQVTGNTYFDKTLNYDILRHVLWEGQSGRAADTVSRINQIFVNIDICNEIIEEQIQTLFNQLNLEGSKLFSEISGNQYEYYYNIEKQLFEIILQEQDRWDILEADISLAQQNNPNAQQLTVNLKFSPGDALIVYVNCIIDYQGVFDHIENKDNSKSYRICIALS